MSEDKQYRILVEGLEELIKDPKPTENLEEEVSQAFPQIESLAKAGRIVEAVEAALNLEKKARVASDAASVGKISCAILSWFRSDVSGLIDHLVILSRRRGQLKRPVAEMVNLIIGWLSSIPGNLSMKSVIQFPAHVYLFTDQPWLISRDEKFSVIRALCGVTEGKLFVEAERARLRRMEASMLESEGRHDEAALVLQDEQVEVVAGMDKRERTEYILEQMRLVLMKKDHIRAQIVSRKLNTKQLDKDVDMMDLKIRFYSYMVEYWNHESLSDPAGYLEVAKCYSAVFDTPTIQADPSKWREALEAAVLFALLGESSRDQSIFLTGLVDKQLRKLEQCGCILPLVKEFQSKELINWPPTSTVVTVGQSSVCQLNSHGIFKDASKMDILKKRVIQNNLISVVSAFYTRAEISRLAKLLGLTDAEVEREIADLTVAEKFHAKIDRPAGIVLFGQQEESLNKLEYMAGEVGDLLNLVEASSHLIAKERMVRDAKLKSRA